MSDSKKHLEDLTEIRSIMERSTRFLSLSGWSGIIAGIIAITGSAFAYIKLGGPDLSFGEINGLTNPSEDHPLLNFLLFDALAVLLLAIIAALLFSYRKAKKRGEKIWTPVTRRLVFHLGIPLFTGGLLAFFFILDQQIWLFAPVTLLFYGIALVSASKYTNNELIWLGIAEILLGFTALFLPEWGIYFWGTGFGILHVIYGITLYLKYDRKPA